MSTPGKNQQLPKPASDMRGANNLEPVGDSFEKNAKLYKPANVGLETPKATAARVALRLIKQSTGEGFTVEELAEEIGGGTVDNAPVAVTDAAARKLAATYTAAEVTPVNGLRVIQDDLPDVVWTLLDVTDITADANWFGAPRTNSSGALPLSGVQLITGNNQFSFSEYLAANSSRWIQSSATSYDAVRLFTGMKVPASLMVAGNKIAFTANYRYFKDSSGISSDVFLTFGPKSLWDEVVGDAASLYLGINFFPRVAIAVQLADLNAAGIIHAVFTLTETTADSSLLYLVADTNFADGGATTSVDSAASYETLAQPAGNADSTGAVGYFAAGEEAEINIGILGAANAKTKAWRMAVAGGINVFVP